MSAHLFAQRVKELYKEPSNFETLALDIFNYQALENKLYRSYLAYINIKPNNINKVSDIPCLPISFFKNKEIKTADWTTKIQFSSSGTSGIQSRHHVRNPNFYLQNTILGFEHFFGKVEEYCFLALLPSYLEREGSSLVYMLEYFIAKSKYPQSGFYLNQFELLQKELMRCQKNNIPTVLFGVPFGLLDLGEWQSMDLSKVVIIETGGMKGRREEITKSKLYTLLGRYFRPKAIYSEYGMTEMFSQAYSLQAGIFKGAPCMQIRTREINDPFHVLNNSKIGGVNVVDLANFDTISFIATDDLGRKYQDGTFEILGRLDNSDLRGCNLLIQESL